MNKPDSTPTIISPARPPEKGEVIGVKDGSDYQVIVLDQNKPQALKARVQTVEPFGVFLDNGGFISITDISAHLGRQINSVAELEKALPTETEVAIALKKEVKDIEGEVLQLHFLLQGIIQDT
jgi:hypothetical protein